MICIDEVDGSTYSSRGRPVATSNDVLGLYLAPLKLLSYGREHETTIRTQVRQRIFNETSAVYERHLFAADVAPEDTEGAGTATTWVHFADDATPGDGAALIVTAIRDNGCSDGPWYHEGERREQREIAIMNAKLAAEVAKLYLHLGR